MKELYQHIKSNNSDWNPDADMLQKYFSGELNASDHYKVEKWISLDEFGDEIGDLQGSDSLGKIDWDHLKSIVSKSHFKDSTNISQTVAFILSSLGIIAFLFFAQTEVKHKVASPFTEDYVLNEIQTKKAIEIKAIKQTLSEHSESTVSLTEAIDFTPSVQDKKERLERKIIILPKIKSPKIHFVPRKLKIMENHPVKYILQFKVVDYFNQYLKERKPVEGLQSEYASTEEQQLIKKNAKQLSVDDVLQAGLEAFYIRDYYLAIHHFDKVLSHYPEDLNAKFYSALSCYKLKDYDRTIELLQAVAEDNINVFLQEAEWYLAKSHYKKGEIAQTINLLDIIIDSGGFYKKKAKEMKRQIKSSQY